MSSPQPPVAPPAEALGADPMWADLVWADLGRRSIVAARGPDAARFIESFTTASVIGLEPGQGTETMFTDARGWVLALAAALRVDDGLILDAEPGLGQRLRDHLEHYHIRERVELVDESSAHAAVLLAGPQAEEWLAGQGAAGPSGPFAHAQTRLADCAVRIVRVDWWTGTDWLVHCAAADHDRLVAELHARRGPPARAATIEAARIVRGTPHPADIREKTLPQELGRDGRAISFTKGCYLGQETVARIDALGHVNRRLAVVASSAALEAGAEIRWGDEICGLVTSVAPAPTGPGTVGMGLVSTRVPDGAALVAGGVDGRLVRRMG